MIIMIYGCVIWRGCESSSGCAGDLSPSRHNIVSVVSSRGATLVLATPTQRQIWRRIIFVHLLGHYAKCVIMNGAKLEPYCL
jgi:hypothetical protein